MRRQTARHHRHSEALPELVLSPQLRSRLEQGHPWVYADQIRGGEGLASGQWVEVRSGNWRAVGLWDARSPIAVRVFSEREIPGPLFIRERVEVAWKLREPIRQGQETTAYRWLYGESDGVPGVVVDLYGPYAVVQTYAESLAVVVPWVVDALKETTALKGIVERVRMERGEEEGERIRLRWGELPPADLVVREHGLRFKANLFAGQKTGLFLDHRENRQLVRGWARGREVLNCFAYTGAFSVYAGVGGATGVVSCDIAPGAIEDARTNWTLNGLDGELHEAVVADCFDLLAGYGAEGRTFDLVILDPPSFARSKQQQYAALRAYRRLNTLALRCVRPGGVLVTASCTSQVSSEAFREMLAGAGVDAGRRLSILHESGQALDHPVAVHFPEGRYLKCVLAMVQQLW